MTRTLAGPPGWAASQRMPATCSSVSRAFAWRSRRYALQSTRGRTWQKRRMSKPCRPRFSGEPTKVTYSSKVMPLANRSGVITPPSSGVGRERLDDEPARDGGIDAVGSHTGAGVVQDLIGVAPDHVLLVGVLELDPQGSREGRQVVLEDHGSLGLEPAQLALAAVVDAGHVGGPRAQRAIDVAERHLPPPVHPELGLEGRRARPAPPRVGLEVHDAQAGHRLEKSARGAAFALPRLAGPVVVEGDGG